MHSSDGGGGAASLSKKRSSLIRKAHQICFFGDADVAFVAFSPCGRLTKFSGKKRIEDILQKYVDLPADQIYKNLKDVDQVVKLRQLNHIEGDDNKVHYLSKQIHHLELQIKKEQVDIDILDANLKDYELYPEHQCQSMPELLWCEKNLNRELQRVVHRKNILVGHYSSPYNGHPFMARRDVLERGNLALVAPFSSFVGEELTIPNRNLSYSQLIMKLDPWISPYSPKVRDTIIKDIVLNENGNGNGIGTTSGQFGESNFSSLRQSWPSLEKKRPYCHLGPNSITISSSVQRPFNSLILMHGDNNVNVGNYDANGGPNTNYSVAPLTNPTPRDPPPFHAISSEDGVGNGGGFGSTTNQEWDDFQLPENLNMDDLDIIV